MRKFQASKFFLNSLSQIEISEKEQFLYVISEVMF